MTIFDAQHIAKVGFNPNLKISNMPKGLIMSVSNLTREYYYLNTTVKPSYFLKLSTQIRITFPQFKGIFSDLTGKTT